MYKTVIKLALPLLLISASQAAHAGWDKRLLWPPSSQKWQLPLDINPPYTDESAYYESPTYAKLNSKDGKTGHAGLDIKAPAGTPVKAMAPGNVIYRRDTGRADTSYVVILHRTKARYNNRFCAIYGHIDPSVSSKSGQNGVTKGQVIGKVMSGNNLGYFWTDHLHLGINVNKSSPICKGETIKLKDGLLGWGRGPSGVDYDQYGFRDPLQFLATNKSRY